MGGVDKAELIESVGFASKGGAVAENALDNGLERYFKPIEQDFACTIQSCLGQGLLEETEKLGVRVYQPLPEYVDMLPLSFVAIWQDRTLICQVRDLKAKGSRSMIESFSPATRRRVEKGKSRISLQLDLVYTQAFIATMDENFMHVKKMEPLYLEKQDELGTNTLSFLRLLDPICRRLDDKVVVVGKASNDKRRSLFRRVLCRYLSEDRVEIQ